MLTGLLRHIRQIPQSALDSSAGEATWIADLGFVVMNKASEEYRCPAV